MSITFQTFKDFVKEHPLLAFLIPPWLFVALPILFISGDMLQSPSIKDFIKTMVDWAPMIDRYSKNGSYVSERMLFSLSWLWASGPIMSLYMFLIFYKITTYLIDKSNPSIYSNSGVKYVFPSIVIFSAIIWLQRDVKRSTVGFRGEAINFAFGNILGILTLGWLIFFILFGLIGMGVGVYIAKLTEDFR